jgi:hypothetical protein
MMPSEGEGVMLNLQFLEIQRIAALDLSAFIFDVNRL